MKLKHYLLIILFPIFIIFAFSPIVSAQGTEKPEVKTETAQVKEDEADKQTEGNEEDTENTEEKKKNTEPARESTPQTPADTIAGTETKEQTETKEEKKADEEQPKEEEKKYEIRFTYNDSLSILTGDTRTFLVCILSELNIKGNVTEVTSSNDKLFSATKENGEWFINSYADFSTGENLYVTADNLKYNIKVICKSRQSGAKASAPYGTPGSWNWNESGNYYTNSDIGNNTLKYYPGTGLMIITPSVNDSQLKKYGNDSDAQMYKMFNNNDYRYLKHIEIEEGVGSIGNRFFNKIQGWGYTVTLPNSLHYIYGGAFKNSCLSEGVFIPSGVTEIESNTFDNCPLITNFFVPNSITSLGSDLFYKCTQAMNIYVENGLDDLNPVCGNNVGNRFPNHASCKFHWHGRNLGGNVYAFPEQPSEPTGHQGNYDYAENDARRKTLEIIGYGAINDYTTSGNSPVKSYTPQVSQIVFNGVFGTKYDNDYHKYVTKIGNYTFYNCTNITTVKLPSHYTKSYDHYYGVYSVDYFGDLNLTTIGTRAFQGCTALTTINTSGSSSDVNTFSTGITVINPSVFQGCTSLPSFTIQNTVTSIGNEAFLGCTSLTTVTLPASSTTRLSALGHSIFQGCTALSSFKPSGSSENTFPNGITTISEDTFWGCNSLASFTISNKITTIGAGAFGQTCLTSITIPTTVTSILGDSNHTDWGAFAGCTALQSITFASGRTNNLTLERGAFYNTRAASIVFPEKLTTIGIGAFQSCTNLDSVTFPTSTLTTIGAEAFKGCSYLTDLTIPTSISSGGLGANAFANIKNRADIYYNGTESAFADKCTNSVANVFGYDLESTATNSYIYHFPCGANLWYGLDGATAKITITGSGDMTNYTYNNTAPSPIRAHCTSGKPFTTIYMKAGTAIGSYALYNCASVTTVILGSGNLSTIGAGAFENCTNLVTINPTGNSSNNNTFPSNVSVINESVLRNCTSLSEFTISSFASSIGRYAFYGDTSLTSITIPASVGSIDESAFQNCSNLTSVTILSLAPTMSVNAFAGLSTNADIWYMYGTKEEFLTKCEGNALSGASTPFGTNSYVFHFLKSGGPDYKCGDNLYWRVEYDYNNNADTTIRNTTFYVTGNGAFYDRTVGSRGWYNSTISPTVTKLVVEGATTIGRNAFYNFTGLTSITLPSTLEEIKYSAFGHTAITSITIPANVTTIGDYYTSDDYGAFQGCISLTTVTFANNSSLTTIGSETFKGCTNLETITIPSSVTTIMNEAFYGCSKLTNVTIPTTISSAGLGANAFANIKNKADIYYSGTENDFASKCSASSTQGVSNVANVFGYDIESNDANSYIYHFPCGASLWYGLDGATATITITGSGSMYTYWSSNDNYSGYAEFGLSPFNSHCASGNTFTTIDMQAGTSIGTYAFYKCASIATITLHTAIGTNALDSIGQGAFRECTNLTSIKPSGSDVDDPNTFPGSVTTMRRDTFWLCTSLTSFTIPSSVTNIEGGTFGKSGLTSINIPTTVTTIENPSSNYDTWGAFAQCSSLAEITFSTERTQNLTIGQGAFYGAAVTSVTIPNKVTIIGKGAFLNCSSLATVNFEGTVSGTTYSNDITSIGQNAFAGLNANANVWYRYGDKASLIAKCYDTNTLDSSFGASNKYIYHFSIDHGQCGPALYWEVWNTYQYVDGTNDIDKNEMTISGSGNFYDGVNSGDIIYGDDNRPWAAYSSTVTSLVVESGATNIGHDAFQGFAALSSVTFESPQTVTAIQYDAFNGCTNLSSITLPSTLTTIGHSAFVYTGLTSITIPASVTNLGVTTTQKIIHKTDGSYADYSDDESGKKIGPFYNCDSLASVTFAGTPSVTYIGIGCFRSCDALTSITIPQTVTTIYENAFIYCTSLSGDTPSANQLTIPAAVTQIKNNAFSNCDLKSVVFSSGSQLTSIGNYAFQKCQNSNFRVLNLPEGLTSVGTYAFQNCPNLNEVRIPSTISNLGLAKSAFANLASKANIYYNGIEREFTDKCTTSVTNVFGYDIAGTAANNYIYHFKCGPYVWYSLDATSGILQVNIYKDSGAPSATTIGTYDWNDSNNRSPFYSHGSSSTSQMNVDVGYGINYIGDSIFQNCEGLIGVSLPGTLNETGTNICENCISLWGVYNLAITKLTVIQEGSFKNCQSLRQAVLPQNLTRIDDEAFYGCSNLLSSVTTIPSTVTSIGDSAFYDCSKLSSVTVPTGITSVGSDSFVGLGTDNSVTWVDITYSGKEAALAAKCYNSTLTGSFGCEAVNNGKYTFHFTQDITYISNGSTITGLTPLSYTTATSTAITLPTLPDTTSSSFGGWYTQQDPSTVITQMTPQKSGPYGDLTYYAKWIITEKAIIYLEVDGSTALPSETYQPMSGEIVNLSIPTKTGHAFLGWHFLQNLTDTAFASFVADGTHTNDVTVYAEWYERDNIPYWANSSQTLLSTVEYEIIKPWETTLLGGTEQNPKWYVLRSDVSFPGTRLTVQGYVNLILEDGCTLKSDFGVGVNQGNSLTIYAQDSDYNYINQNYSSVDEVLTKMNLQSIEKVRTIGGITYGKVSSTFDSITNLSNGNVYYQDYYMDSYCGETYSDGIETVTFGNFTYHSDEEGEYYIAEDGVTHYALLYDDTLGQYYVTADGGTTKYYYVEDVEKVVNTKDKNDCFWIPYNIEPSEDDKGQYITIDEGVTKYYIYGSGSYMSADNGVTKYYNAYYYGVWTSTNHHQKDIILIDYDDFDGNWQSVDYYLDTDTLKTYYNKYDINKECYYYYETTDTEQTHKYYETDSASNLFTEDLDEYNTRKGNIKEPGMLIATTSNDLEAGDNPYGAVIGGNQGEINGDITIYGGNYALTSCYELPSIGTGWFDENDEVPENNSNIIINGGNFDFLESSSSANIIGGSTYANGGKIEINGGRLIFREETPMDGSLIRNSIIGAGYRVPTENNDTTVRLSWTNITDFIMINTTTDGMSAINCSELTFKDESDNPKDFVFAYEERLTETSHATEEAILAKSERGFTLIPYPGNTQYVLQIPARTVVPFRTTNHKLRYDPQEDTSPTIRVQTKPDDESTENEDESTPLVKPYRLVLTMAKINFRRITGTDGEDNPTFSDQDIIVFDLLDANNDSLVDVDEYFSSDSDNYDHYQITDLGGSESAWINIDINQWEGLTSGIYQGSVTFNVGLATNGASQGQLPFSFPHVDINGAT